jgi:peptidoglycan/LPS O-acetylase OafA/YrhL
MGRHRKEKLESSRLKPLDGLRAIAVGIVFLHHVFVGSWPGGFMGVEIFFAISGYIITSLLLREWQRTGSLWLGGFYIRRFLRLMPALVVSVVILTPIGFIVGRHDAPRDGLAAITYTMDIFAPLTKARNGGVFAHTWTLAVEEQFYLLWPLLLLTMLRHRIRAAWVVSGIGLAATAATIAVTLRHGSVPPGFGWTPFPHLPSIVAGVLLAFALSSERPRARLSFLTQQWVPVTVFLGLLVAMFTLDISAEWLYLGGYLAIGLLAAALVGHVVLAPRSLTSRTLSTGPILWLGRRSYGFYLWHYPIVLLSLKYLHNTWVHAGTCLVLTMIVTELSWHFVEQPILRLKDRQFEPKNFIDLREPSVSEPRGPSPDRAASLVG